MNARNAAAAGRNPVGALLLGLGALVLTVLTAGWRGAAASYLAAWLALLALPVGALPIAIVLERFGLRRHDHGEGELSKALRRLVALMPVAAILGIPILVGIGRIYPWTDAAPETPLAAVWFTVPLFALRVVAYLAAWVWLAARFVVPAEDRADGRTVSSVALHAVVGTLAVTDLVGSLDHRLGSSLEGLLVLTAWSGLALAAAILLAPEEPAPIGRGRAVPGQDRLVPLVVLLSLWAFLHFVQFLIVWSANLPQEVMWYFARGGWLGRAFAGFGGAVVLLGALATLRPGRPTTRVLAALTVVLHAVEMFWFVTPALRDRFVIRMSDVFAAVAVGCLGLALRPLVRRLVPLASPRRRRSAAA
ncbi:hypothetical protein AFCDBAGC_4647 [Methylobacterium cerastii]|uniref:Uncharacterized protein n=1 Tax=Methylobacterium cerastii TaxID=932741 RepID=A0ABQ4QNC4_9HYPH|nr:MULTISPECIES: hypothetical protein [Methylobacterium]TXM68872.1 hypothetical protein FV226_19470 [Methylobacterium sp. WL12]TXN78819.1 hypothetical protein FV234_22195 [Methylobacterium sp. WL8]GJD46763.1 hypothetical protein AFCDBAGC_4647 [Methylobacterium cerastii]